MFEVTSQSETLIPIRVLISKKGMTSYLQILDIVSRDILSLQGELTDLPQASVSQSYERCASWHPRAVALLLTLCVCPRVPAPRIVLAHRRRSAELPLVPPSLPGDGYHRRDKEATKNC